MKRNITMRTLLCGPNGTMLADKSYKVDGAKAKDLVAGGYATYDNGEEIRTTSAPETATAKAEETAVVEPGETAVVTTEEVAAAINTLVEPTKEEPKPKAKPKKRRKRRTKKK